MKLKNNSKKFFFWGIFCFVLIVSLCYSFFLSQNISLGLKDFYGSKNFYLSILKNTESDSLENNKLLDVKVDPLVAPYMGWKTDGQPVANPTKVAFNGLYAVLNGNIARAKVHANWLKEHSVVNDQALLFPFKFDFEPYEPFVVKAPWYSGLTQGISLGLFTYLYKSTGDQEYLDTANQIYNSYLIPIEKGGFTRFEKDGPFFEEYPTVKPTRVLNGAAVAMLALHDYAVITSNKSASQMFENSIKRLEKIISEYETQDPKTGITISYYSLGKPRPELLGRFFGDGNFLVDKLTLVGTKNAQPKIISTLDVGAEKDDSVEKDFYVYLSKKYVNWGESLREEKRDFREVNSVKGIYNHSPFKLAFTSEGDFEQYSIEVTYKPVDVNNSISLQLFDEKEYWEIGKLTDQEEYVEPNNWKTDKFIIPNQLVTSWLKNRNTEPLVDEKYLDDNQILVSLLGNLSGSQILLDYANRWKQSEILVPAQFFNKFPPKIIIKNTTQPILANIDGGKESRFTEYPSTIKIDNQYLMFYSGYGEDKRWRIFLSTSYDGNILLRKGLVFKDEDLPKTCRGNTSFPYVVKSSQNNRFYMYFSCSSQLMQPYDKIVWASSVDGFLWKYEGVVVNEGGLDPLVVVQQNKQYEMFYYLSLSDGSITIKQLSSNDGISWKKNQSIIQPLLFKNFSTLGSVFIDKKLCLLLESIVTSSKRHETLMYCRNEGDEFHPSANNPINIDEDWLNKWDNIKYGFNVLEDGDKVFVFYNGIRQLGTPSGGSIGKAELNMELLKVYANNLVKNK